MPVTIDAARAWIARENSNPSQITVTDRTASGPAPDGTPPTGNVDWSSLTGTPTSAAGYGIVNGTELDAFAALGATGLVTRTAANTYAARTLTAGDNVSIANGSGVAGNPSISVPSMPWADVTGTPTTLAGYGITDAQPLDADLTAIAALSTTGYARRTGANTWGLDSFVPTSLGGTGFTSYASGDLLYGNGGGTLSKLAEPGLPGYVLSAIGGAPAWAQLSTLTATTITGTANQVLVNGTSGSGQTGPVTLTLPQDYHTGATPQFAGIGFGSAGSANRFVADFSTGTLVNRFAFISSVTNGSTSIAALPNGTNVNSNFIVSNSPDLANSGLGIFAINNAAVMFGSTKTGTGTTLPISFELAGVTALTLATSLAATFASTVSATRLGVGTTANAIYKLHVVGGDNDSALIDNDGSDFTAFFLANAGSVKGGFQYRLATNNFRLFSSPTGGNLDLGTEATDRMRVSAAGNILVGTTSESGLFGSGNIRASNALMTAAPSGGSAQPWKLGNYTAGVLAVAGRVRVEINGVAYDLLTA